jgi:ABC-type sugar transport system ATPase subunit
MLQRKSVTGLELARNPNMMTLDLERADRYDETPGKGRPSNSRGEAQVLPKVSLRNIVKRFGAARLFEGFNLEVVGGELLCLLGPSGSGKTTLLRLIAGLEELDDGDIFLGDREISRLSPRERQIGMMFQGYALYPHLSVRENLAYPLRVRHVPRSDIAGRVNDVARLLHIEPLLDRSIQQVSGGEQQRVAIGRAIIQKPSLYLLDEPISNLDASLRESVRTEVRRLQRELGATMIMVTHDQLDALAIADRIAVLRKGELQQCGVPEELYLNPANLFVAGFIGQSRMNLLPCHSDGGADAALRGQGFSLPAPAAADGAVLPARDVIVGFRPEAVEVHRRAVAGSSPATVETVQFQGERLIALMRLGSEQIHVSLDARKHLDAGAAVWLAVAEDQLHVFDRESGVRLSARTAPAKEAAALMD